MYRKEVPAYAAFADMVETVNAERANKTTSSLERFENLKHIRHGAIRLGSPEELSLIRRIFAVMGMLPVGYYDLSVAGIPVHSTAFRPVTKTSLKTNPFRMFVSLLRLDLIDDEDLRHNAEDILAKRVIVSDDAMALLETAEAQGGLTEDQASSFVDEIMQTFKWHAQAQVSEETYKRLRETHGLIADIVAFKGPHINHLTPPTSNIETVQSRIGTCGVTPKAVIEGPPLRQCPILLRQTAFRALEERTVFQNTDGSTQEGSHTARFGEVESRGAALTPKGRALYDELLSEAKNRVANGEAHNDAYAASFSAFPDTWNDMRVQGLAYFEYHLTGAGASEIKDHDTDMDALIDKGVISVRPILYEDFLPVSAAGIFQSNLKDDSAKTFDGNANQSLFENQLGADVLDPFELYQAQEKESLNQCLEELSRSAE